MTRELVRQLTTSRRREKFIMKKLAYLLVLGMLIVGCGGGSDGGGAPAPEFERTPGGFPIVAGTYAFNMGATTNDCELDNLEAQFIGNMNIIQNEDQLTMESTSTANLDSFLATGFELVSATAAKGAVAVDGQFFTAQTYSLKHEESGEDLSVTYDINGTFSTTAWSGKYDYTIIVSPDSCTFKTTFSGNKAQELSSPAGEGKHEMRKLALFFITLAFFTLSPLLSDAHRSGCHRWHSCPSDTEKYTCGDKGYCSACPDNRYCEAGKPKVSTDVPEDKKEKENSETDQKSEDDSKKGRPQ